MNYKEKGDGRKGDGQKEMKRDGQKMKGDGRKAMKGMG